MNKKILIGVVVVGMVVLGFIVLHLGSRAPVANQVAPSSEASAFEAGTSTPFSIGDATSSAAVSSNLPRVTPAGFNEYRSARYAFSLLYPDSLTVKEYDEGGGAETITFQNPSQGVGFQIFIVPYEQSQVTTARLLQDEPSGVHTNVKNGLVAGATAAAFDGKDAVLGDTREVWFIHGGFLYEVTTVKSLDAWLSQIISSWQFI